MFGSIETHDGVARLLANLSGRAVVSVDYRLAPEHKFPRGRGGRVRLGQVGCGQRRLAGGARRWGGRSGGGGGGQCWGGNLAAVVSLMARDAGGDRFVERQALFYPPSTHMLDSSPSIYEYGEGGLFLTMDQMRWFGQQYLRDIRDAVDPPRASPPF